MSKPSLFLLTSVALACSCAHAHERQQGAHEHGVSDLTIAQEGGLVEISLEGAADNFLGFEHAAKTRAQRHTALQVRAMLQEPGTLFSLPAAADCRLVQATVESPLLSTVDPKYAATETHDAAHGDQDHGHHPDHDADHDADHEQEPAREHSDADEHEHEHDHEHQHEHHSHDAHADGEGHSPGGHSNIYANYRYQCAQPQDLDGIEIRVIEALPRHQRLRVDVISDAGARSEVISQARASVSFKP